MKMHVLLMAGGGVALVALAAAGLYGTPLATLLLVGLLLLCPLMMLGMMGGSHDHGRQGADANHADHAASGSEQTRQQPR